MGDEEISKSFLVDTWLNVGSNDLNWGNKYITGLLRAVIQTYFSVESLVLPHSYQNPERARSMTFSSLLQSMQKYFERLRNWKCNSKSCSCLYQFSLDHVMKTNLLLIRLKAEYVTYRNVALTSETPGKSVLCVGQSSASGPAGTEDFSGRRLGDRGIKCCCYRSTKFVLLLLTKELVLDVLWSSTPWLWFSPSVPLLKVIQLS